MAIQTIGAFVAGVGVGWVARSTVGSTREAVVEALVLAHRVRDGVRRLAAEQAEWAEDLLAEGRARYAALREQPPLDAAARPHIVAVPAKRPGEAA